LEGKWAQSQIYPCIFMKPGIICVVYVDDTIISAQQLSEINWEIMSLGIVDYNMQHTFTLRDEGKVSALLGIQIKRLTSNKFQHTQPVFIDKILTTMNLENCNELLRLRFPYMRIKMDWRSMNLGIMIWRLV
jgi:hypothetical protein